MISGAPESEPLQRFFNNIGKLLKQFLLAAPIRTPLKRGVNENTIAVLTSLSQPVRANCDEKHGAHESIALKERAIDSGEIAFLYFVFVQERSCD